MITQSKTPFREIIWHFVCSKCKLWWSFGTNEEWKPKGWHCPHCGEWNEK